ncbi:nitrogen fixation protein NifM [Pectobacterium peruviense]|uniref:nitrogen fixation protein NifM n=1 Tax=Pectobacterium peruviense TaxID=2066479 RepID=UPI000DE4C9C6|nr:nitrogen fixation protein NifM [Pectobacterium peruviense]
MLAWQRFSEWRLAQKMWNTTPTQLPVDRQRLLQQQLARQLLLEQAVVEAAQNSVSTVTPDLVQAVTQELESDLRQSGFSAADRTAVIQHHVLMAGQLASISEQVPLPTSAEVEQWYRRHAARFCRPEQRLTRHLLLTTGEDDSEAINRQLLALRRQLQSDTAAFATLAERHSQCPTALEGGLLGWVSRGLLFMSLDQALFALHEGELSAVIETDIGWHLLLCEAIRPETPMAQEDALAKAYDHLLLQRQKEQQRQWLAQLVPSRG